MFDAFADPNRLTRWWGPKGFTSTFHEFDLRPGGVWRFVLHGPNGADYQNESVFVEVVKPERIEALGLVLLLALLLWRLVERTLRVHVETTGNLLMGWDKKATQKPTAFMMMTKFAGVMVLKVGGQRQLAHPLSTVQLQYLLALGIPATYFTVPQRR